MNVVIVDPLMSVFTTTADGGRDVQAGWRSLFTLDETEHHRITFLSFEPDEAGGYKVDGKGNWKMRQSFGFYSFVGDGKLMMIALSQKGPLEKIESTPGSDVTLLTLVRAKAGR
jgi:hypothetical protein